MKTVVVMQPYCFPYLGYFQLAAAASEFVFLDDVTYIKGGWINRNRLLVQGQEHLFTIPIAAASSHRSIDQTKIANQPRWAERMLKLLEQSYAGAPFQHETTSLVASVVAKEYSSIGELAATSVRAVCEFVGLDRRWAHSRNQSSPGRLKGVARILEICQAAGADRYVNAPGGKHLYRTEDFSRAGIELKFLRPVLPPYRQFEPTFVGGLSILDVLMFNPRSRVREWMEAYELE